MNEEILNSLFENPIPVPGEKAESDVPAKGNSNEEDNKIIPFD